MTHSPTDDATRLAEIDQQEERWRTALREKDVSRWKAKQIDELKAELGRRHLLDELWQVCADVIGSLEFDLVDARRLLREAEEQRDILQAEIVNLKAEARARQMAKPTPREWAGDIARDIAELPVRTSPDDWPDALIVTHEEVIIIAERHIEAAVAVERTKERARCAKIARHEIGPIINITVLVAKKIAEAIERGELT